MPMCLLMCTTEKHGRRICLCALVQDHMRCRVHTSLQSGSVPANDEKLKTPAGISPLILPPVQQHEILVGVDVFFQDWETSNRSACTIGGGCSIRVLGLKARDLRSKLLNLLLTDKLCFSFCMLSVVEFLLCTVRSMDESSGLVQGWYATCELTRHGKMKMWEERYSTSMPLILQLWPSKASPPLMTPT